MPEEVGWFGWLDWTSVESWCKNCWLQGFLALVLFIVLYEIVSGLCRKKVILRGKHVLVTGGSQGIGFAVCQRLIEQERVRAITIVARNKANLQKAKKALEELNSEVSIHIISCDTTDEKKMVDAVHEAEKQNGGSVDVLFAVAGLSRPGYILEQTSDVFRQQMNVNYIGTVNAVLAVLPGMTSRRAGSICLVSSGICAGTFIGYGSYAPTKFAVRAFADTLRNEMLGFNVHVCVSFPPDTETPGFEQEEKTKPVETTAITPPATHSAAAVACDLVQRMKNGKYHLHSLEMDATLSVMMTAGIAPRANLFFEALAAPILIFVQHFWRVLHADKIAKTYGQRMLEKNKRA